MSRLLTIGHVKGVIVMRDITMAEVNFISGGSREEVLAGVAVLAGTALAIAALPEVLVGASLYAAWAGAIGGGAAGGGLIGDGYFWHHNPSAQ